MNSQESHSRDLRFDLTEKHICKCGMELLRKKPISDITVNELCTCAGINRSTFYRHFADMYDLRAAIEDECLSILATASPQTGEIHGTWLFAEITERMRRSDFFNRELLENLDATRIAAMAIEYYETPIKAQWRRMYSDLSEKEINCTFNALIGCLTAIIDFWVKDGMPESSSAIDSVLHRLGFLGLF